MLGLNVRYPVRDHPEDDLDRVVSELEEGWAEATCKENLQVQWPVEKAARICPVFRYLTGRAINA